MSKKKQSTKFGASLMDALDYLMRQWRRQETPKREKIANDMRRVGEEMEALARSSKNVRPRTFTKTMRDMGLVLTNGRGDLIITVKNRRRVARAETRRNRTPLTAIVGTSAQLRGEDVAARGMRSIDGQKKGNVLRREALQAVGAMIAQRQRAA